MKFIDKIKHFFTDKQPLLVSIFIHLSAISLFFLPELITNMNDNRSIPDGVLIKTLIYIVIFYANFFLINKFLDRKYGRAQFFGFNTLLLILASVIILHTSHGYTDKDFHPVKKPPHPDIEQLPPPHSHVNSDGTTYQHTHPFPPAEEIEGNEFIHAAGRLSRDLLIAILTIALAFAIKVTSRWLESQRKQATLIASQRETELENLKSQINPHFLFNTLNSIYALIAVKPVEAQKAVHELSGMMRYAIYESSEMVTLKQEFDFLNNYISLMKVRMNEKRPIEVSLSCNNHCNFNIAPLLFIPIVENAFKYGNTGNLANPIKISIDVTNGVVKCYTFNHFDNSNQRNKKDSGVGFSNLQRRLNIIYGNNASFKTIEHDDTFQVELSINLNNINTHNP